MLMHASRAVPHTFRVGDSVLVKQPKQNKLTPAYEPKPLTITAVKGSMITASRPGRNPITRNRSFFKKIPPQNIVAHGDVDYSEDDDPGDNDVDPGDPPDAAGQPGRPVRDPPDAAGSAW